jgi:hypothetical protein
MSTAAAARRRKADLLELAKKMTSRRPDGTFDEQELENNLVTLIDLDLEKSHRAKEIIDSQCSVGQTLFDDQLHLPGFDRGRTVL